MPPPTIVSAAGPTTTATQMRKFTFTSKFNKFNCSCIYDLVEEKDMAEFNSLLSKISKIESSAASLDPVGGGNGNGNQLFSGIKIYLRFNWYSFSDLNMVNPAVPFSVQQQQQQAAAAAGSSNIYLSSSSSSSSHKTSSNQLHQMPKSSGNYPFMRHHQYHQGSNEAAGITTSNSGLMYTASGLPLGKRKSIIYQQKKKNFFVSSNFEFI